jgi:hypothetical protein
LALLVDEMKATEFMSDIAKAITFKQRLFFASLGFLSLLFPGFVFVTVLRAIAQAVKNNTKDDAEFAAFFSDLCES